MSEQKNLGFITLILGGILLVIVLAWFFFGQTKIVSPLPEEGIRVIFESPKP